MTEVRGEVGMGSGSAAPDHLFLEKFSGVVVEDPDRHDLCRHLDGEVSHVDRKRHGQTTVLCCGVEHSIRDAVFTAQQSSLVRHATHLVFEKTQQLHEELDPWAGI